MEKDSATWRKSTYSGANGGQCVEVGVTGHVISVRDSKDPDGLRLAFGRAAWRLFAGTVKAAKTN